MYPDSISYLHSATYFDFQGDRPVFYSLWLAVGHILFPAAWFAVVAQSLITALLIRWILEAHGIRCLNLFSVLACAALAIVTGICWQTGRLMPDAFSALLALSFYILVFCRGRLGWVREGISLLILVFCLLVHYSHILIVLLALTLLGLFCLIRGKKLIYRPSLILVSAILAVVVISAIANKALGLGYIYSKNPYAFLVARMVEEGSVAEFLEKNCQGNSYIFCDNRAYVTNQTVSGFLWGEWGPFRSEAGQAQEYIRLILGTIRFDPERQLKSAAGEFARQLLRFGSGDSLDRLSEDGWQFTALRRSAPNELKRFVHSKQQAGKLWQPVFLLNNIYYLFFWVSGIFLLIFYLRRAAGWADERALALTVGLFLLANAFVCGAFSVAVDRYQSRVAWLPVFVAILILARIYEQRSSSLT